MGEYRISEFILSKNHKKNDIKKINYHESLPNSTPAMRTSQTGQRKYPKKDK